MEKITTRAELIERLKDVRAVEMAARDGYSQDLMTFRNLDLLNKIGEIEKDENVHISILSMMISMLESE